jgi:hypothetical protein
MSERMAVLTYIKEEDCEWFQWVGESNWPVYINDENAEEFIENLPWHMRLVRREPENNRSVYVRTGDKDEEEEE